MFLSYDLSYEECSEIFPEYFEPLVCGSEKIPQNSRQISHQISLRKIKKSPTNSAGAQGETAFAGTEAFVFWNWGFAFGTLLGKKCGKKAEAKSFKLKHMCCPLPLRPATSLATGRSAGRRQSELGKSFYELCCPRVENPSISYRIGKPATCKNTPQHTKHGIPRNTPSNTPLNTPFWSIFLVFSGYFFDLLVGVKFGCQAGIFGLFWGFVGFSALWLARGLSIL